MSDVASLNVRRRYQCCWESGGGGGGDGAILIASSGAINITGSLIANGGTGGTYAFNNGGGSGGAIRIVATAISGLVHLLHCPGLVVPVALPSSSDDAGTGGKGRIRLEADEPIAVNGSTNPFPSVGQTQALILPGLPTIRIGCKRFRRVRRSRSSRGVGREQRIATACSRYG